MEQTRPLTALEINLERTKAVVEIPERYRILLDVAKDQYGVLKRAEEMLIELNHPFVNWEYVLTQLKGLSIGDFYDFNVHDDGLSALETLADIYLAVISSAPDEEVKDNAVRYLFEYLNTILSNSGNLLPRNAALFSPLFQSLADLSLTRHDLLKKSSSYMKATAKLMMENHVRIDLNEVNRLLLAVFKATYLFWLTQPDPSRWLSPKGETQEDRDAYQGLVSPLSHEHIRELLARLEEVSRQVDDRCRSACAVPCDARLSADRQSDIS